MIWNRRYMLLSTEKVAFVLTINADHEEEPAVDER